MSRSLGYPEKTSVLIGAFIIEWERQWAGGYLSMEKPRCAPAAKNTWLNNKCEKASHFL